MEGEKITKESMGEVNLAAVCAHMAGLYLCVSVHMLHKRVFVRPRALCTPAPASAPAKSS